MCLGLVGLLGQRGEWLGGWVGWWMVGWVGGWIGGWVVGWVGGWMDGWVGGGGEIGQGLLGSRGGLGKGWWVGWMDGWLGGWVGLVGVWVDGPRVHIPPLTNHVWDWHGWWRGTQHSPSPHKTPRLICAIALHVQGGTLKAESTWPWHRAHLQIYPWLKRHRLANTFNN